MSSDNKSQEPIDLEAFDKEQQKGDEKPSAALDQQTFKITAVVIFYFSISLSLVFTNKLVLANYDFPYPLFMTWIQLIIAMMFIVTFGFLSKYFPLFAIFPPFEFKLSIAQRIAPLTIVYLCMIAFNNLCLRFVEVTFYQVARALTIFFSIIFTRVLLQKSTTYRAISACCIVVFGFAAGSMGEVNFEWRGLIFGVLSSAFVALYSIFVKKVLPAVEDNHWRLLIYNTLLAIVFLFPVIIVTGEIDVLQEWSEIGNETWVMLIITGVFGYLINIAIFMQIRYTSPLTNSISGTAKACLQTLLGYFIFRNEISMMNGAGITLVIIGSAYYSKVRYDEMKANDQSRK